LLLFGVTYCTDGVIYFAKQKLFVHKGFKVVA